MQLNTAAINIPKNETAGSEDSVLNRQDLSLFGVFDGMGGPGDGDIASRVAREAVETFYSKEPHKEQKSLQQLGYTARDALMQAEQALQQYADDNEDVTGNLGTTATVGHIFSFGDADYIAYAHVGDSSLAVFRGREDGPEFITREEAEENVLQNALTGDHGALQGVQQYGVTEVRSGDRLVFFTDGISGDREEERLSRPEYREALSVSDPRDAARNLIDKSRKTDDKAVLVVDIAEGRKP